jgi:hypothetical protein
MEYVAFFGVICLIALGIWSLCWGILMLCLIFYHGWNPVIESLRCLDAEWNRLIRGGR